MALQVGQRLSGSSAVTNFAGLGLYRLLSNVSQAELRDVRAGHARARA